MVDFKKFNKTMQATVREGIDTKAISEKKGYNHLSEFEGKVVAVDGFFFTEGDYGKQVVVVGHDKDDASDIRLINMPKRATEQFEEFAGDADTLKAILAGHLALVDIQPKQAKRGPTTVWEYDNI